MQGPIPLINPEQVCLWEVPYLLLTISLYIGGPIPLINHEYVYGRSHISYHPDYDYIINHEVSYLLLTLSMSIGGPISKAATVPPFAATARIRAVSPV